MADISAGALRFDLTADNSQFMQAVKQSKEAHVNAASEMGKKFEEASDKADKSFGSMIEKAIRSVGQFVSKMRDLDKAITDTAEEGAEGFEKAFTDGFNRSFTVIGAGWDRLNAWLKSKGPIGQSASAVLDVAEMLGGKGALEESAKKASAITLSAFAENFNFEKYTSQFRDGLVQSLTATKAVVFFDPAELEKEQSKIKEFADGIKQKFDDMVEGIREALRKLAGTWDGIRDNVKAVLDALAKQTENVQFRNGLIGLDTNEKAYRQALNDLITKGGKAWEDYNAKEKEAMETAARHHGDVVQDGEDLQKQIDRTERYEQAVKSLVTTLKRQGDMASAATRGKSVYERSLEQGIAQAEARGVRTDDSRFVDANEASARERQLKANEDFNHKIAQSLKTQGGAYNLQAASLGLSAGAAEEMRVRQQLLNEAQQQGVDVTDRLRSSIDGIAAAQGRQKQALAEATERFNDFRQVGMTVASSLESAFSQWITGTQFQWKSFIQSLEQDLARLAFKKGVESLLTGSSASGGGLMGWISGLLGGGIDASGIPRRAGGGDVTGGQPYIVGEKRPELFVPRSSGTIIPDISRMGGRASGPTSINMTVDLKGANGDETIARMIAVAGRQILAAAKQQAADGYAATARRQQLLGA